MPRRKRKTGTATSQGNQLEGNNINISNMLSSTCNYDYITCKMLSYITEYKGQINLHLFDWTQRLFV